MPSTQSPDEGSNYLGIRFAKWLNDDDYFRYRYDLYFLSPKPTPLDDRALCQAEKSKIFSTREHHLPDEVDEPALPPDIIGWDFNGLWGNLQIQKGQCIYTAKSNSIQCPDLPSITCQVEDRLGGNNCLPCPADTVRNEVTYCPIVYCMWPRPANGVIITGTDSPSLVPSSSVSTTLSLHRVPTNIHPPNWQKDCFTLFQTTF